MDMESILLEYPLKKSKASTSNYKKSRKVKMEGNNPNDENEILIGNCAFTEQDIEISTSEFIIDEDPFNISPNVSDPCVDPLAIDDFNVEEIASNINDSEYNVASENVIYIVDVDDIKDSSIENPTINSIKISSLDDIHSKFSINVPDGNQSNITKSKNNSKSTSNEENEMPSDGSDSGLGLESNLLKCDNYHKQHSGGSIIEKKSLPNTSLIKVPTKSSLKRRSITIDETILPPVKRGKRSIQFDNVKVFYFPRIQGFCCVPSQGGCTLGMGAKHLQSKTYKLSDHVNQQNGENKLSMQLCNTKGSSSDDTDSEEDLSEENVSDLDPDSSGFLQPVPVKTRRALLKAAGIKKIDSTEKDDCRSIRSSREYCGCVCRGFCDPDTCACSQSGIKCQVDRPNFPCGCTRDGCANIHGRVEFNPNRVRTHFIHTIMRLEIENKSKTNFIQDVPTSQRFFQSSTTNDAIYGGESSGMMQNGLQFFPDAITVNNDNNFDLFPLHNGEDNARLTVLQPPGNDINVLGELSYTGLKSFFSPSDNYQNDETADLTRAVKLSQNNKNSMCAAGDLAESKFSTSFSNSYETFSSAYTNFLDECGASYPTSKIAFMEKSETNDHKINCNENLLDVHPVQDLLNINRNNCLPSYSIPASVETNNTQINFENDISVTKICTLAPSAHTSTSICEGTSTTTVSNYVLSLYNMDPNDTSGLKTELTPLTTKNSTISCANLEPKTNEAQFMIEKFEASSHSNTSSKPNTCFSGLKDEKDSLLKAAGSSTTIPYEVTTETLTFKMESDFENKTDETQKQYQSFNLTNSSKYLSLSMNNKKDETNRTTSTTASSTNLDLLKDI